MDKIPHMVSMERSQKEAAEDGPAVVNPPLYPYGLQISLGEEELEKLDVDYSDWSVGDFFHLHALAKITSISEREMEDGKCCRVEMQIVALSGEDEDNENEESEKAEPAAMYGHL